MDGSSVSVLCYRRLKPQGKVRRRVQDLRIPSSSYLDFKASGPRIDLSHNESARMAVDSLLSCGLEEYNHVLDAEGEVDFLSQLEKTYILENGWDGRAADPGAADDRLESFSADSQGAVHCPVMSTDSGSPVAVDTSTQKGVKKTDCVLKPSFEIYFQSDRRAPGMKDLVREFMQKATVALAIVMDSFSDVELLCDLLGASRKRNVSVHLLLDHLNLNLFISMWQELQLDSKNFPKLSVRSVDGQTYCAKTGRKLTGQIVESFIITDWTEVLTGSYSFSWLSWQVHRSLAVLVKGSAVIPFHEEFHRLNSSSKEIPGFVTYITVPLTVPKLQNNTPVSVVKSENAQTQARKVNADPPRSAGSSTQPLQSVSAGLPHHAVGAVCIPAEPLEDDLKEIQSHQCAVSDTHSSIQSQFCNLTVGTAAERRVTVPESNPVQTALPTHRQHRTLHRQTAFNANSNLAQCNLDLFCQQSKKDRFNKTLRTTEVEKTETRRWLCPPTPRPKVHLSSDYPKAQFHSTSQHKEAETGLFSSFPTFRGHISGLKKISTVETWRHHQPHLHSHLTTEPPSSSVLGTRLKPQHLSGSKLLSPGSGPIVRAEAPPRLNPIPWGDAAKPRLASRHKYLSTMYQTGWRPFHSRDTALRRSKSLTERRSAGLTGADLIPT